MDSLTKTVAFLLLIATVCQSAAVNGGQAALTGDIQNGEPFPMEVPFSGDVPVPILYVAPDYSGPYDPFDADGSGAASHRALVMSGKRTMDFVKSYIPPNLDEFLKAEIVGLLKREGQRFLFSHPKEATDLYSMYRSFNKLLDRAQKILRENENGVVDESD